MQKANSGQISKIHVLLNKLGLIDNKAEIVYNLSNGRTQSTKDLFMDEARRLILNLATYDPCEKQKGLIFSLAYKAGIIYGSTVEDKKMNAAKLSMFIKERGVVKKDLNSMTYDELVKTHRQFEGILSNTRKSQAGKAVRNLLNEFNIPVK